MAQNETPAAVNARKRTRLTEAERRERLPDLVLRRTALTESEISTLREVFPEILAAHHDSVWGWLRRRGMEPWEAEDLLLEGFETLYFSIVARGFPSSLPAMLRTLTKGKLLNFLRDRKRAPETVGLPSSGSEKPRSEPDVERAMDLRKIAYQMLPTLVPEHRAVVEETILHGLDDEDAAEKLGIPVGTLKSRLIAAKHALLALADVFLPLSQRKA